MPEHPGWFVYNFLRSGSIGFLKSVTNNVRTTFRHGVLDGLFSAFPPSLVDVFAKAVSDRTVARIQEVLNLRAQILELGLQASRISTETTGTPPDSGTIATAEFASQLLRKISSELPSEVSIADLF